MNYYDVLGVSKNADPAVIRAAYKVMVQKYHPDKFSGLGGDEKIVEINLAFETLSDSTLRRAYDDSLQGEESEKADYAREESADFSYNLSDWEFACKYTPELKDIETHLAAISPGLSGFFRAITLETKDFKGARAIALELERNYLFKYFGSNSKITGYARTLLLQKRVDAAKELNKVVSRLGSKVDAESVISKIDNDFPVKISSDVKVESPLESFGANLLGVVIVFITVVMVVQIFAG